MSYCEIYFFLRKSRKIYLDTTRANVAPIEDENDTSIIALYGSKIIPELMPNKKATGSESVVSIIYKNEKYNPAITGLSVLNFFRSINLEFINLTRLISLFTKKNTIREKTIPNIIIILLIFIAR